MTFLKFNYCKHFFVKLHHNTKKILFSNDKKYLNESMTYLDIVGFCDVRPQGDHDPQLLQWCSWGHVYFKWMDRSKWSRKGRAGPSECTQINQARCSCCMAARIRQLSPSGREGSGRIMMLEMKISMVWHKCQTATLKTRERTKR